MTEKKIDYFSYPTGTYTNPQINLINELISAGYRGAVTVVPGFNMSKTNRFMLHRDIIYQQMSLPIFRARVLGNIDAIPLLKQMSRLTG
jgi:hypothetical protein